MNVKLNQSPDPRTDRNFWLAVVVAEKQPQQLGTVC